MGTNSVTMPVRTITAIVDAHVPNHPVRRKEVATQPVTGVLEFMEQELAVVVSTMWNNEAPGPDGIPAEVLNIMSRSHLLLLLNMFNMCLVAEVFLSCWKKVRLALIVKGKDNPDFLDTQPECHFRSDWSGPVSQYTTCHHGRLIVQLVNLDF